MELVENLIREHRTIHRQLEPFKQSCLLVKSRGPEALLREFKELTRQLEQMILINHLQKEEEQLFPQLQKIGVSVDYGPIGVLLKEHRTIREFFYNLKSYIYEIEAGEPMFLDLFCHQIKQLSHLMERHTEKEETVLFEIAKQHLQTKSKQSIEETTK